MNNLPKILDRGSAEPSISTEEYWNRFTLAMLLHPSKIQVEKLLTNQRNDATEMTEDNKLNIHICKATFMMAIGDQTVKELQARNPKVKIFEQDLSWLKQKWDEAWTTSDLLNQKLVTSIQGENRKHYSSSGREWQD